MAVFINRSGQKVDLKIAPSAAIFTLMVTQAKTPTNQQKVSQLRAVLAEILVEIQPEIAEEIGVGIVGRIPAQRGPDHDMAGEHWDLEAARGLQREGVEARDHRVAEQRCRPEHVATAVPERI